MSQRTTSSLDVRQPIWERCFLPSPLVIVGTLEADGGYDFAPKHMATPLGWENVIGFVCTPSHSTYRNAKRDRCFTVSYPRPEQVLLTSMAASPRCENSSKLAMESLPATPARVVRGVLLEDAYLQLECELERIVDDFGRNSLIAGRIVEAHVAEDALRGPDIDDQELLTRSPLLVYLHPGRYAAVAESLSFPFPAGFRR